MKQTSLEAHKMGFNPYEKVQSRDRLPVSHNLLDFNIRRILPNLGVASDYDLSKIKISKFYNTFRQLKSFERI